MKKVLNIIVAISIIYMFSGCTKGWEKMNINPNATVDVPVSSILTYVERATCGNLFNVLNIGNNTDAYANHMTQIMNIYETAYHETDKNINQRWLDIMSFQVNLNKIITKDTTSGSENPAMVGVSKTISVFSWLIMTDTWGSIPYTQGAKGEEGFLQPEYDNQQTVYKALLAQLDEANTLLSSGEGKIEGDAIYGNNQELWRKFANSLRMRVAIHMSNVDPGTATTIITDIVGNQATYPIMESNEDNANFTWIETDWQEPFAYDKIFGSLFDNYGMCDVFINALLQTNDPRIGEFAHPAVSDGQYRGVSSGASPIGFPSDLSIISRIGYRYRDNFAGKTYLMRYPEVCFIKAEAFLRGLAPGGASAARVAYEEGIAASCLEHDVTPTNITTYMSDPNVEWDASGDWGYTNLQKIYYQKWVSLFKEGHEAWAETRRTDVPLLTPAPGSIYVGHTRPPFRWPYPVSEYNLNNFEVKKWDSGIVDRFWGSKMWWDTRGEDVH